MKEWLIAGVVVLMAASAGRAEELVDTLAAAITTWQSRVEFYCTFKVQEATAVSLDDAREGRLTDVKDLYHGVYAKRDNLVRLSLDYGHPPIQVSKNETTEGSVDEVTDGTVALTFVPRHRAQPADDYITVSPFRDDVLPRGSPVPGAASSGVLNPLLVFSNPKRPNLLNYYQSLQEGGEDVLIEAGSKDDAHMEVRVMQVTPDYTNKITIVFWMEPSIPVVTRGSIEQTLADGTTLSDETLKEDFVEVEGGIVPRTVRGYATTGQAKQDFKVWVWRSDDLGDRMPTDEDFRIKIRDGARIHCLKPESVPAADGGYRTFDIQKITLHDIMPDCLGGAIPLPPKSRPYWLVRLLGFLVFVTLIAGMSVRWYRNRRAGSA